MNTNKAYEKLQASVEYPDAWTPEPGDTLVGEALRWETVTVKRDDGDRPCEVLTLRDPAGKEHNVWTWHTVLQNELVGKVSPGNLVALHYRGRRARQSGDGDYAAYRVAIETGTADTGTTGEAQDAGIPF